MTKQQDYEAAMEYFNNLASGKQKPKDKYQLLNHELIQFVGMSGVLTRILELIAEYGNGSRVAYISGLDCDDYYQGRINVWGGEYRNIHVQLCKKVAKQLGKEAKE